MTKKPELLITHLYIYIYMIFLNVDSNPLLVMSCSFLKPFLSLSFSSLLI